MLVREKYRRESVAESTKLVLMKVHRVNAGENKNLIQQLARARRLISIYIKLMRHFVLSTD